MRKFFQTVRQKKWAVGVILLFFAIFLAREWQQEESAVHALDCFVMDSEGHEVGGDYELRRATDTFSISGEPSGSTYQWSSLNENILKVDPATATSKTVSVSVNNDIGRVGLQCTVTDRASGETVTLTVSIEVVFSINEFLSTNADQIDGTVKFARIREDDERRSLILKYGDTLAFGSDAKTQRDRLNLIFGDASDMVNASWSSSNPDVVTVVASGADPHIMAVGAGKAKLTVIYQYGADEYTDTIDVYVRPEIRKDSSSGELIENTSGSTTGGKIQTMEKGDKIWIPALFAANPLEGILDKVTWVIANRGTTGDISLVRDSLGNMGEKGEDVNLVYNTSDGTFRLDAKAGQYVVLFYVKDTYIDFETEQDTDTSSGCEPVFSNIDVNAIFRDKNVTISIDGSYNMPDALNISLGVLQENFSLQGVSEGNEGNWVEYDWREWTARGLKQGTAKFKISYNGTAREIIPGVNAGDVIDVSITVTDTFTLNITNTTMAVGAKIDLQGIIGSGQYTDSSSFVWESSDTSETYVTVDGSGRYATVVAKKETTSDEPVTVTLSWTNDEGVTRVASCRIYVNTSATTINLNQTEIEMAVGSIATLRTTLMGQQNLTWISSDTDIVTVLPNENNTAAELTAGKTTGTTIVTVLNKDNNAYATCRVTVTAAIEEISIDQGENVDTILAAGFVFLKAVYSPSNATNTELKWTTSDPAIATVDENGVVTLLQEGTVWISVEPTFNPGNIVARCCINIKENPVTDIETDVTELDMIAGDMYEVRADVIPANATYPTLTWATDDESIAKVEGGVITAVAPGDANITVANGTVFKIIKVHVRNRLLSIEFTEKEFDLKEGTSASLRDAVIFDPSEHVNTNLSWSSTNSDAVSVDENGVITGLKAGDTAWITCVAEDLGVTGAITCAVHVIDKDVPATGVTLDPLEATMYVGDTLQVNSVFTPVTATYQNLSWSSTDENLATVDENGLVTAVAEGTVSIGAVYKNPIDNTVWDPIYCKITIIKVPVPVQGVALSPESMEVYIGQSLAVVPVFTPEDATNKAVTFQSSDDGIASVDQAGMVTGVASGSAVIICRTGDGGFVGTCNVKVISGVSLTISPTYREIAIGKTFTIKKTILPEEYKDTPVTWESSNTKIATVTKNGKVKGIKKGTCTVTCTLDKYGSKAVCEVKVAKLRTTIKLNKSNIRIGKGQTYRLKATVWSNNSTKPSVKWATSNRKIATVGQKGLVKAKKIGYVTIKATTTDKIKASASCRVRVILRAKNIVIKPNYATCYVGRTRRLKAVVKPKTTTIKAVTWKSADKSIATVEGGMVRGVAEGTVNITATTKDGSRKKATCILKVLEETPASSIVVAQSDLTLKRGDSAKLSYTVLPNNTSDSLTFASDNKRVATVNSKGVVKAVGTGSCTITIMSSSGTTSTVSVNVVALNRTTLTLRQYDTETLTVNGTSETITWYSSNANIATVENGKVVGRGIGSTYVYAYVKGCKLACRVTVTRI